jgi:hypothetical protein
MINAYKILVGKPEGVCNLYSWLNIIKNDEKKEDETGGRLRVRILGRRPSILTEANTNTNTNTNILDFLSPSWQMLG